jgi:hypothetical protein
MTNKTITLQLTPVQLRVLRNGLDHEWDHLQKIKTPLGVQIANEQNAEERVSLLRRYDGYTAQQEACNELLLKFESL